MTTALSPVLVADQAPEALAPVPPDLHLSRAPELVLAEARRAARALADVLEAKPKKVVLNGEAYLEFEDWQTLGRFYGITAKVVETRFVELANVHGFDARAVALRADGGEISAAEASCLTDEPHWRQKPLFQLRSMAQTRACAKVLRNVLAWVVVLAGYKPTPAEELTPEAPPPAAPKTTIVHVLDIQQKRQSGRFTITGSDREKYSTFRRDLADIAKAARDGGTEIEIGFAMSKYGREAVSIRRISSADPVL